MSSTCPFNQPPSSNFVPTAVASSAHTVNVNAITAALRALRNDVRILVQRSRRIMARQEDILTRLSNKRRLSVSSLDSINSSSTGSESDVSIASKVDFNVQNEELAAAINALKTDHLDDIYTEYLEFTKTHNTYTTRAAATVVATEFVSHMIQHFALVHREDEAATVIGHLKALDTDLHLDLYRHLGKVKKDTEKEVKKLKKREMADKKASREKKARENAISKARHRYLATSASSASQVASQQFSQQSEDDSNPRAPKRICLATSSSNDQV